MISSNPLEATDRDGFWLLTIVFFNPATSTGRFARPVASATENAGEHV
jgi:hypothetical protein